MKNVVLALMSGAAGGIVGYVGFRWMAQHGFYALILPGGLVGLGASLFQSKSTSMCVACGVLALAIGIFAEWQFAPFMRDGSLGYFVTHLHQLSPVTLVMIAAGTILGFWGPFGRVQALRKAGTREKESGLPK
jgi:hypothetical protein